jgi:hypothetical protein
MNSPACSCVSGNEGPRGFSGSRGFQIPLIEDVMQIPIPIPRWLLRAKDTFQDWANVPVWQRGQRELRRIDALLMGGFIACVSWYYLVGGWQFALAGGMLYVFFAMIALWF